MTTSLKVNQKRRKTKPDWIAGNSGDELHRPDDKYETAFMMAPLKHAQGYRDAPVHKSMVAGSGFTGIH
jgi:hypothetical protein